MTTDNIIKQDRKIVNQFTPRPLLVVRPQKKITFFCGFPESRQYSVLKSLIFDHLMLKSQPDLVPRFRSHAPNCNVSLSKQKMSCIAFWFCIMSGLVYCACHCYFFLSLGTVNINRYIVTVGKGPWYFNKYHGKGHTLSATMVTSYYDCSKQILMICTKSK